MNIVWLFILCLTGMSFAWGEAEVSVDKESRQHLGLQFSYPRVVNEIPIGLVPASVTVPPDAEYMVSAPLAGVIDEVKVVQGEPVVKGQMLVRLRSPELLLHQQHLLSAWQDFQVAKAKYEREKPLFQQGIIAKGRWLETRKNWRQARTALAQARGAMEILGLPRERIDRLLQSGELDSRLPLHCPDSGVVTVREAVLGQRVERLTPLFRIASVGRLWLEMAVPAAKAAQLRPGAKVAVEDGQARGEVRLVAGIVDSGTQTVRVVAELVERGRVRPGLKVNARLYRQADQPVMEIPRSAIVEHEGNSYVFVVKSATQFQARPVTLAALTDTAAYVEAGLEAGDQVVSQGVAALKATWVGGEE